MSLASMLLFHAFERRNHSSLSLWSNPLKRLFTACGVILGTFAVMGLQAPEARALEEIKLSYRGVQLGTLLVEDLANFASTGEASQDIQALLNVIDMDEESAIALLSTEMAIDGALLEEAAQTFVGESFFQLVATTIEMPEASEQGWTYLRDALLASASDNQVTMIEVLQTFEADSVIVDTERVSQVSEQVQNDISVMRQFLRAAFL